MNNLLQTLRRLSIVIVVLSMTLSMPSAAFAQYYDDYGYYGYDYGYSSDYSGYDYSYDYYDPYYDYSGDYGYYGYDYGYSSDYSGYDYSYDYYDPYSNDYGYYGYDYGYSSDYSGYDYSYDYYDPYNYDSYCYSCGYDDYSYDYGYGGYSTPSYYGGYNYSVPSYAQPRTTQTQSSQVQNTTVNNVNNSVNNSGNTTIVNSGNTSTQGTNTGNTGGNQQQYASLSASLEARNVTDGGSFSSYANADAGDVVAVAVTYRNTSNVAIPNLRLNLSNPNTSGSTFTFTGSASGDNVSTQSGSTYVYTYSNQTLTQLNNQISWYPNGGGSQSFPNGQSGSQILSGSLNLGTIPANGYGFVEVQYRVGSNNTGNATVNTNSANNISSTQATLNGSISFDSGVNTANVRFEYGTNPNSLNNTTSSRFVSGSQSFSDTISGLSANTTYYYRAVADGGNLANRREGSVLSFSTYNNSNNTQSTPIVSTRDVSFTGNTNTVVLNGRLDSAGSNNSTATVYFEYGTSQSLGSRSSYRSSSVGNFSDSITGLASFTTYYYRAVAQNSSGTVYGNILTFNTGNINGGNNNVDVTPNVTTNNATLITGTSARLNGFASMPNTFSGVLSAGWFEWGTTPNLGSRRNEIVLVDPTQSSFYDTLTGLTPFTTYYYRAAARTTTGREARGATLSFTTGAGGVVTTTPSPAPSGAGLRVSKVVDNRSFPNGTDTEIAAWGGNTIEFNITVTNSGSVTLNNLTVSDRVPDSTTFKEAEQGGRVIGGDVEWNISLAPNESRTFTYRVVGKHLSDNVVIERTAKAENSQISRISNSVLIILNKFPLSVSATNSANQVRRGEEITYTIRYKNEGDAPIDNVRLEATLPAGVEFLSASGSTAGSHADDTVIFSPGRLQAEQEQVVTITARVSDDVVVGEILTMSVRVTYTDEFGETQFDEKAFTASEVVDGRISSAARSGFTAALAGLFTGFLPGSLIGWLILIILLILLAIVVKRTLE